MKQETLKFTFILGAFWVFVMGFLNLILKENYGLDYDSGWAINSLIFLSSALVFNYTTNSLKISKEHIASYLKIIAIFLAIALCIDYIFPISIIKKLEITNSKILFPLFSWNIFVAKSSDIIFQQILINILVEYYIKTFNRRDSVKYFGIFFAIIHLPLFYIFGLKALYFIIPSILGGTLFAYLIAYFYRGYLLSLGCHFFFYIVLGIVLRYYN
ncbi:hypothetical protein [Halobacteriovorax sp. DPLXC-1]|uniref:hypothetical protein n=1 Tax=Halobacteriovorax sp. DPLXC-1 TaxID=3110771 RepID=UPI002FEF91DF